MMKERYIAHTPCLYCSFSVIIDVLNENSEIEFVKVIFGLGKLNVSDAKFFLKAFVNHVNDEFIAWIDTPQEIQEKLQDYPKAKIYTTSRWNEKMIKDAGVHVDGIIPRPVNTKYVLKYQNNTRKFDFITIAGNIITNNKRWFKPLPYVYIDNGSIVYDKKGLKVVKQVIGKKIIISNESNADYKIYSISEDEKYKLISSAKFYLATSHSEGFGMGPVEAMAVGTVPIFPRCHAYDDWLDGLSIKCSHYEIVDTPAGKHRFYFYDEKEYLEVVEQAKAMKNEEWEDLSFRVKERGKRFYAEIILKELGFFKGS